MGRARERRGRSERSERRRGTGVRAVGGSRGSGGGEGGGEGGIGLETGKRPVAAKGRGHAGGRQCEWCFPYVDRSTVSQKVVHKTCSHP